MPGTWRHLTARFFQVLTARPLEPHEVAVVDALLRDGERAPFFSQSVPDQRHGLASALAASTAFPDRGDLQRAALLHDVGKRHARLGVIGRVFASIAAKLHLPVRGRYAMYLEHGPLAAAELSELGCERVVVDFARHHHGPRPADFPASEWDALEAADR